MIRYAPGAELWGEPLATLRRIQDEINRAFGDQRWAPSREFPPVNVWRGTDGIIVTAEIPGVGLGGIDLTVQQNTLTIKGKREPDVSAPGTAVHKRERTFGAFTRSIELPFNVDADQVKASVRNGILSIELPRPESDKPRKIHIRQS
jgi:HSP20 family protein